MCFDFKISKESYEITVVKIYRKDKSVDSLDKKYIVKYAAIGF